MAGNPLTDPNWAADTTDQVVKLVDNVKAKTTKPAVMVARGLVFGLLAFILGMFAFVLFLVLITRGMQALLDIWLPHERSVYVSYFAIGGVFTLAGLMLFKKRNDSAATT
ncbi:MAG: hypothetical protein ACJAR2_000653 [Ilumatobacter sp.]|jgi:hypothetical protein